MTDVSSRAPDPDPAIVPEGTVAPETLKAAFRHHAAGVVVVTAEVDGGPIALTASSLASVSDDPALALVSVSMATGTGRRFAAADSLVVHLLEGDDHGLALLCADPAVTDRFADAASWRRLPTGEPAFNGPRLLLRGAVADRRVYGGSMVIVFAVTDVHEQSRDDGRSSGALAYHDRTWHALTAASAIV